MRFLALSKTREAMPPEVAPMLVEAMRTWLDEHRGSGALVDVWSFAGLPGGGGILEVDSTEQLDAVMSAFPFGPFSDMEIYPLSDIDASLTNLATAIESRQRAMG